MATTSESTRLTHLENQFGVLTSSLTTYIADSKIDRERNEKEMSKLWSAITEQGDQMRSAIKAQGDQMMAGLDKVGSKGTITWQMIFAAVSVIFVVMGGVAAVNGSIVDGKIARVTDRFLMEEKVSEAKTETVNARYDALLRICLENHEAIKGLKE